MEFKSQICTTIEQSQRLIALGLKKQTADMYHYVTSNEKGISAMDDDFLPHMDTPAWSLHRLIEICSEPDDYNRWIGLNIGKDYDWFINLIERDIQDGVFNKEYLNTSMDEVIAHIQSCIHLGYIDEEFLDMDVVAARENENIKLMMNQDE